MSDMEEQQLRERLEVHVASWLLHKSQVEFFEGVKPSRARDRLARAMGRHGYGYRLSEWREVSAPATNWLLWEGGYCFALAETLAEPVNALWSPEVYIEAHRDNLGPWLAEGVRLRALGPEAHLRARHVLADIPPASAPKE